MARVPNHDITEEGAPIIKGRPAERGELGQWVCPFCKCDLDPDRLTCHVHGCHLPGRVQRS